MYEQPPVVPAGFSGSVWRPLCLAALMIVVALAANASASDKAGVIKMPDASMTEDVSDASVLIECKHVTLSFHQGYIVEWNDDSIERLRDVAPARSDQWSLRDENMRVSICTADGCRGLEKDDFIQLMEPKLAAKRIPACPLLPTRPDVIVFGEPRTRASNFEQLGIGPGSSNFGW